MSIEKLSEKLYKEVLSEYNAQDEWNRVAFSEILEEKLKKYNETVSPIIMSGVYYALGDAFKSDELPSVVLDKLTLSKMLYRNSKKIEKETLSILNDSIRAKKPIKEISLKLYDGYNFKDAEILDIRKKLPLYLKNELKKENVSNEFIKYVDNIKTKPLRTALKQIADKNLNTTFCIGSRFITCCCCGICL